MGTATELPMCPTASDTLVVGAGRCRTGTGIGRPMSRSDRRHFPNSRLQRQLQSPTACIAHTFLIFPSLGTGSAKHEPRTSPTEPSWETTQRHAPHRQRLELPSLGWEQP